MKESSAGGIHLEKGLECLLNATGRHFLVRILDINGDTVRITFPGKDYPVEGIAANLEFHDEEGFFYCETEVIEGPAGGSGPGVLLRKLTDFRRSTHRQSFRAPTDLTVQVKEQVHARRYNGALINISAGGALVQSDAPFDFSSLVELSLSLPGEPAYTIVCQVVHMIEGVGRNNVPLRYLGLKFIDLDSDVNQALNRYACQQLRKLYASAHAVQTT